MISTNLPFLSTSTSLPPFGLKNHSWIFQPSDYINASFIPDQLTGYPRKYIAAQVRNLTGYPRKYIAAQVRHLGLLWVNQEKKGVQLQFQIIVRKENSQLWKIRSFHCSASLAVCNDQPCTWSRCEQLAHSIYFDNITKKLKISCWF